MRNPTKQYSKLRQREALVFVLQLEEVKILSVKAQKVIAVLGGVIHAGGKKGKKKIIIKKKSIHIR